MVNAMTDEEHWNSVLNIQLRDEHEQARYIGRAINDRGITARSFSAYAIVVLGVNTWREHLNNLDDNFLAQVDSLYQITQNWDKAYCWAILGSSESLSLDFISNMAETIPDPNTVIELVVGKRYSVSLIWSIFSNDIDLALIKNLMAASA